MALQFGELQYLLFIAYDLQSAVKPHISHSPVATGGFGGLSLPQTKHQVPPN